MAIGAGARRGDALLVVFAVRLKRHRLCDVSTGIDDRFDETSKRCGFGRSFFVISIPEIELIDGRQKLVCAVTPGVFHSAPTIHIVPIRLAAEKEVGHVQRIVELLALTSVDLEPAARDEPR